MLFSGVFMKSFSTLAHWAIPIILLDLCFSCNLNIFVHVKKIARMVLK